MPPTDSQTLVKWRRFRHVWVLILSYCAYCIPIRHPRGWLPYLTVRELTGVPRGYIGRLSSGTVALQNLFIARTGNTVIWMRSGASPEVWCVTFESSRDNVTYDTLLGAETRIPGCWQLTGLRLLLGQNLFICARGYYAQGSWNASNSVIESV